MKRFCSSWCYIAIVFLVANIYVSFTADKTDRKDRLYKTLSPEGIKQYENIVRERRDIYLKGYIFGLIISILFLYGVQGIRRTSMINTGLICIVGAITLICNYLFYIIHPKSDYMVLHLNTKAQRQAWLDIYRHMQFKYHSGLVFGIIAAMLFAKSVC
jgi:hypothetical protein